MARRRSSLGIQRVARYVDPSFMVSVRKYSKRGSPGTDSPGWREPRYSGPSTKSFASEDITTVLVCESCDCGSKYFDRTCAAISYPPASASGVIVWNVIWDGPLVETPPVIERITVSSQSAHVASTAYSSQTRFAWESIHPGTEPATHWARPCGGTIVPERSQEYTMGRD